MKGREGLEADWGVQGHEVLGGKRQLGEGRAKERERMREGERRGGL